ncbi:MAG: 50S ribosomal protein L25/general stress protein Ctc [Bacillaceae bacterium]|nr:50S ribosomal protein L25/general stress protein Ctc [Bacillaceae bacterium]
MSRVLQAENRNEMTRAATRSLRKKGRVPAILYGEGIESQPIHVDGMALWQMVRDEGLNHVIRLKMDGDVHHVMVYELQREPIKGELLHIDFKKILMDEPVETSLPIKLTGEPEGVKAGGVMQSQLRELEVRCLPDRIPEELEADVSSMQIGDSLTVGDLTVPDGVEVLHEEDEVIVSLLPPRLDPIDKAEEDPGEPELVDARDGPGIDEAK